MIKAGWPWKTRRPLKPNLPFAQKKNLGASIDDVSRLSMDVIIDGLRDKDLPLDRYPGETTNERLANFIMDPKNSLVDLRGFLAADRERAYTATRSFLGTGGELNRKDQTVKPRTFETQSHELQEFAGNGPQRLNAAIEELKQTKDLSVKQALNYAQLFKTYKRIFELASANNENFAKRLPTLETSTSGTFGKTTDLQISAENTRIKQRKEDFLQAKERVGKALKMFDKFEIAINVLPLAMQVQGALQKEFEDKYPELSAATAEPKADEARHKFIDLVVAKIMVQDPSRDPAVLKDALYSRSANWHSLYDVWRDANKQAQDPKKFMANV